MIDIKKTFTFTLDEKEVCKCLLCDVTFCSYKEKMKHIKSVHDLVNLEQYIVTAYYNGEHPKCKCGCGTELSFKALAYGPFFKDFAKNHWPHKKHTKETKEKIKVNLKKSIQEKYGVDNVGQLYWVKEEIKKTNIEHWGVEYPMQSSEIKSRAWHTQSQETIDKIINTNRTKYHANSYTASELGKQQIKNDFEAKHGNGITNVMHIQETKERVFNTNIERTGYKCNFENPEWRSIYNCDTVSKYQLAVMNALSASSGSIDGKQFDVICGRYVIEVDGPFHTDEFKENMYITQINTAINDENKNEIMKAHNEYEFIRIRYDNIPDEITIDNLKKNSYVQHHSTPQFKQKLLMKEYLLSRSIEQLEQYELPILFRFVRKFVVDFPYPDTEETLDEVITKINKFDYTRVYKNNDINNNTSVVGMNYLKSIFKSYWKASFGKNKSPYDAFFDDEILKKVIAYRIGLNESRETFDFSLHQLLRGLSAYRYTVSMFKPIVAAAIYKKYLGDTKAPIVFDPCSGFGGRLLGFKSMYPDGTYIGLEPNRQIYSELFDLSKNFSNVKLHNVRFEDFDISSISYDFSFSSIPYFDKENYGEKNTMTIEEWKSNFLTKILSLRNCAINMSDDVYKMCGDAIKCDSYLLNKPSHFSNGLIKKEPIIILR